MTTPDSLDQQWLKSDDPIATVMAEVRVATTLQQDLREYAKRPDLEPGRDQQIRAAADRLQDRLRQADVFVDRYATAKGLPEQRNYLLGSEPRPRPQSGKLVDDMVWFATESVRLMENMHRRLNLHRAAQAERALTVSAAKGDEPARLSTAAWQLRRADPNVHELLTDRKLPATRMLLDDVTTQLKAQELLAQGPNKLRKKNPLAEAAASRIPGAERSGPADKPPGTPVAAAAALTMATERPPADPDAGVTHDRNLLLQTEAMMTLGTLKSVLTENPWAEHARGRSTDQARERTAIDPATRPRSSSPSVERPRSASPARR